MISDKNSSNTYFKNIFPYFMETVDDLIIVVSLDNSYKIEFIYKNKYLQQLGYSDGILLGKSLLDLVDFGNGLSKTEIIRIINQNKNKINVKVIKKNGKYIWAEFRSTIFNNENNQQKAIVRLRDISKIKELEKTLEETENTLEKISILFPEIKKLDTFTTTTYNQDLKETEAQLKTAIECLPFDVFIINKKGKYILQNSTCREHWGNIIGKRPEDVATDSNTLVLWKNNNARAFAGECVAGEVSFNIGGELHYFYNIINPVYIDNEIAFIIGINIDISERKMAEQRLKESEEKHREMLENLDVGFFRVSIDGIILTHNRKYNEIFGIDPLKCLNGEKTFNFWQNQQDREKFLSTLKKSGYVKNYITPAKKVNGETIILQGNSHLIHDNKGLPIATEGTIIDITEKYNLQSELEHSEKKYRDLVEWLPNIIFELDLNLKLVYVNQIGYSTIGFTKEDIKNDIKIMDFIEPEYREKALSKIKMIIDGKKPTPDEYLLRKKDGSTFYARIHSRLIYKDNKPIGIRGVIMDVNDIVLKEKEVRESEERFSSITEQSLLGIAILQDNRFKYVNRRFANMGGRTIDEVNQWGPGEFFNIIHPKDRDKVIEYAKKRQQGIITKDSGYECRTFKKNGEIMWVQTFSKTITYDGKLADLITTIDITDRKLAEYKLKESEDKFRTIAEQSLMAICIIQDFEIKYINQQMAEIYGYPLEEIKQWKPREFVKVIHPDSKEMVVNQLTKKQQGSEDITLHYIAKIIKKNGAIRYVENYSKPIKFQGQPADLLTQIDITAKLNAEHKLLSSEEKYRHLYENSPNVILLFNMKGEIIDCNYISEELSGFKREELIGKSFRNINFIPKTFISLLLKDFKSILNGNDMEPKEIQLYTKSGELKWVNVQASLFNYENEKIIQVIIQIIDEKKKSEQKIKESEEKYRNLFENSPIGLMIQDYSGLKNYIDELKVSGVIDFERYFDDDPNEVLNCMTKIKLLDVNKKTLDLYKYNNEENFKLKMNKMGESMDNITSEEVFLDNKMEMLSLIRGNMTYESEIKSKTLEGEPIYLYAKTSIVPGFEKNWSKIIVSLVDITDIKLTEQRLKESEEKYHKLFETSPDGVVLTDLKGNILECNSAVEDITGYSPKKFIGNNFIRLDIYHEKGLEKLIEGYKDLLRDNNLEFVEFPIIHKDSNINWVQVRSILINMKGQTYILAVIHDVTTQKQAEKVIKASEQRYRELLESSSVGVIELDVINSQIIYMNPKLVEIIGYRENELTEDHFLNKLIHPKDIRKLIDSNEESELEFRIFDKFGKLKWLTGKKIPHYDENGKIFSIRIWLEDITEKKMYENLIYELNVNFLNFTADIKNNIQLLLTTCLNLLNGDFIIYINKTEHERQETYQLLTHDNKSFMCDAEFFADNLFVSALFYESHDFPQTFFDINKMSFANTDPFIARYNLKGCFGKLIKSQNDLESAVCVFYKGNPVISNQDKLVMFLVCDAIEIEQRRWQVQRGLEEQNITLNKINNLKTELFSRTSHELKTPLISIKGFTELLLTLHKPKLDNDVLSILEEIKEGSKRLEKIINLLLESTKLEAGQLELNLKREDLSFLINFCVKELKGLAKLRHQSINLKIHDTLETYFDKERIYEVFSNLLVNAIKYTPPGGNITIETTITNDSYLISVKDTGIGFTNEEKKQAFKQFGKIERYGQGWDVAIEGTGLGLYITKKLVELHGGKIWLESKGRNKGSTFYFSIPKKE